MDSGNCDLWEVGVLPESHKGNKTFRYIPFKEIFYSSSLKKKEMKMGDFHEVLL